MAPAISYEVNTLLTPRERVPPHCHPAVRDHLVLWKFQDAECTSWEPESRLPNGVVSEYWRSRFPHASSPELEPPLTASLRRSRRLQGLDAEPSDSHHGPHRRAPDGDHSLKGGMIAVMGEQTDSDPVPVALLLNICSATHM